MGPYYVCCGYDLHWIGRSWIFLYNWGIVVLHVFIAFLGGVPLCIPYGLYSRTSLGTTIGGILGGFPGRVLSAWYQSSRFLNS